MTHPSDTGNNSSGNTTPPPISIIKKIEAKFKFEEDLLKSHFNYNDLEKQISKNKTLIPPEINLSQYKKMSDEKQIISPHQFVPFYLQWRNRHVSPAIRADEIHSNGVNDFSHSHSNGTNGFSHTSTSLRRRLASSTENYMTDLEQTPILETGQARSDEFKKPEIQAFFSPRVTNDDDNSGGESASLIIQDWIPSNEALEFYLYYKFITRYYEIYHRKLNYEGRDSDQRVTFAAVGTAVSFEEHLHDPANQADQDVLIATTEGNLEGFIVAKLMFYLFKRFYPEEKETNPLYRASKTAECVGQAIGAELGLFLPIPEQCEAQKLFSGLLSYTIGAIAGILVCILWPIRKPFVKLFKPLFPETKWQEGWTKNIKTFLIVFTALGGVIGGCLFYLNPAFLLSISANIASVQYAITAVGLAVGILGAVMAPFIIMALNHFFPVFFKQLDKKGEDAFRNNYPRTGVTVMQSVGAVIGYLLAPPAGLFFGSAIGGTIGAALSLYVFPKITRYLNHQDSSNSWDYATQSVAKIFFYVGFGLGYVFSPASAGAVIGVALTGPTLFSNIMAIVGALVGFRAITRARQLQPDEEPSSGNPWSQRILQRAFEFSSAIAALTLFLVYAGPLAAISISQAVICSSSAGIGIGALYGAFEEPASRKVWKLWFKSLFSRGQNLSEAPRPAQNGTYVLLSQEMSINNNNSSSTPAAAPSSSSSQWFLSHSLPRHNASTTTNNNAAHSNASEWHPPLVFRQPSFQS